MLKEIEHIYGIINVPISRYSQPTKQVHVSNIHQVSKILTKEPSPIIIALCVVPKTGGYKKGTIIELVQLLDFVSESSQVTTGQGYALCESVFIFGKHGKTREFFGIKPHAQYLIRKLREEESLAILNYSREVQYA